MEARGSTRIVGIFGHPILHTLSPAMHNAAFKSLGLDYIYLPFDVKPEDLKKAVAALVPLRFAGLNVTVPHKQAIVPMLDEVSTEARMVGAVNTVQIDGPRLVGHNTDGQGFIRSIEELGVDPKGKRAIVLGAGGAARAVVASLVLCEAATVVVANRTFEKAEALCREMSSAVPRCEIRAVRLSPDQLSHHLDGCDILVNSTSVGLETDDPAPIPVEMLSSGTLVMDLIYNPPETRLLKLAREAGLSTANGLGMLLYQGAIGFKKWTGCDPPIDAMREALERAIGSRNDRQAETGA